MSTTDLMDDDTDLLACEICLKEIPVSEAASEEASDYVLFYFGAQCHDRWLHQRDPEQETAS